MIAVFVLGTLDFGLVLPWLASFHTHPLPRLDFGILSGLCCVHVGSLALSLFSAGLRSIASLNFQVHQSIPLFRGSLPLLRPISFVQVVDLTSQGISNGQAISDLFGQGASYAPCP